MCLCPLPDCLSESDNAATMRAGAIVTAKGPAAVLARSRPVPRRHPHAGRVLVRCQADAEGSSLLLGATPKLVYATAANLGHYQVRSLPLHMQDG